MLRGREISKTERRKGFEYDINEKTCPKPVTHERKSTTINMVSSTAAAAAPPTIARSALSAARNSTEGTWVADIDSLLAKVRKEVSGLIATSSPTTKTICAVLGCTYIINFVAPWVADYFALVPERTIPCVWNIVGRRFF